MDRPFFDDIHLRIKKNHQEKIFGYPYGKLRTILGQFNRLRKPGGVIETSKNTLYFTWKDIVGFKFSSIQSKIMMGISVGGKFVPSSKFMTHNIGLNVIPKEDIDFFRLRIGRKAVDVKPEEISKFEVNIDSQQIVINRAITKEDNHIARFRRLKLFKGDQSAVIHKVVPFNRGESNFEMIQMFLGTRYTEFEKVRHIRAAKGDLDFLAARSVVSCDLSSHLVLDSMNLLGILPLKPRCIGFSPNDIRNSQKMANSYQGWVGELNNSLTSILDTSKTPNFTEHNFKRLTKNLQLVSQAKQVDDLTTELMEKAIQDLEGLTKYMDDFFKLDIYNKFEEDLECETSTEVEGSTQSKVEEEYTHLDDDTKDFIGENYAFFQKRGLVQKALLQLEQILFYNKHVKKYAEDPKFEPDLVVYSSPMAWRKNYHLASYPAINLSNVIAPEVLKKESEEDELAFVQFMRAFTKKVYEKSLELNKSFHHQYKHTLSELSFFITEKLQHLRDELEFLENPANKEAAYTKMLEKVTNMFREHLLGKEKNIEDLEAELKEVQDQYDHFKAQLEKLLRQDIAEEKMPSILQGIPDRLENMRQEILQAHRVKKKNINTVFTPYFKFQGTIIEYFTKVEEYADLFQKALWIRQQQQMFEEIRVQSQSLFNLSPEELEQKIEELNRWQYNKQQEVELQEEVNHHHLKINASLDELRKLPLRGLFSQTALEAGELNEYLTYYSGETNQLVGAISKMQSIYLQLNNLQNSLFKKQGELVAGKIQFAENDLLIRTAELIFRDPNCQSQLEELLQQKESVPKEIKEILGALRNKMTEALTQFKKVTLKQNLEKILNYKPLLQQTERRTRINNAAKELVNFSQGIEGIGMELEGERKDIEFMRSQEPYLEQIVMSKTLPSTRVLLKTLYIPLVEKEQKLLEKANLFLGQIISNATSLKRELSLTFFKMRHSFPQFVYGAYCFDSSKGSRNHTEKNIFNAHLMLAENYKAGCAAAGGQVKKISLNKLDVIGVNGVKSRIQQICAGLSDERVLFLPASITLQEALEVCESKDRLVRANPRKCRSHNSLVLVYIGVMDFEEIRKDVQLRDRYHQAIMSNIFINIDGETIYNNRDSLFEAMIIHTFGRCNDDTSRAIYHKFLYGE